MNRKKTHKIIKTLNSINIGWFLLATIIMIAVSAFALRSNNQNMITLRDAVYRADESNGDTESALRQLRQYVHSHMNTNLSTGQTSVYPPIQLKYTYERLVAAQQEELRSQNESIYSAAQSHCEQLHPESYSGGPRVPCIRDYVSERGVQSSPIPDGAYKFDFVSPRWSPDFAGFSVVVTFILALITIARMVIPYALKKFKAL
jgi:hypothetical protein